MARPGRTAPIKQISDAVIAASQDPNQLFTTGAIIRGRSLYYIAHVLASRLQIKASSVAHTIRGYRRGCPRTRRLTREEYDRIFDGSRPFRLGEIQVTEIPGLDEDTADFSMFHWAPPHPQAARSVKRCEPELPVPYETKDAAEQGPFDLSWLCETDGSICERESGGAFDGSGVEWFGLAFE
jgi:hypothetical protein